MVGQVAGVDQALHQFKPGLSRGKRLPVEFCLGLVAREKDVPDGRLAVRPGLSQEGRVGQVRIGPGQDAVPGFSIIHQRAENRAGGFFQVQGAGKGDHGVSLPGDINQLVGEVIKAEGNHPGGKCAFPGGNASRKEDA
ncbi:MAG: hypothetical protein D0530_00300, partial [Methylococcales bacterium]